MSTFIDLAGKKFGRLIVLEHMPGLYHGQALWLCKCVCGKTKTVNAYSLRRNRTQSCGCLVRELGVRNVKKDVPFNTVWRAYHCSAKAKKRVFKLSRKDFRTLLSSPCFYCGAAPARESKSQAGNILLYNGIDRINSKKGYEKENCVSCCTSCNFLKKDIPIVDFIHRIRLIAGNTRTFHG